MLVELATEGNSEVACCSTGDCIGGVQRFATIVGAPALADLHVLEAGLHTGEDGAVQGLHLNKGLTQANIYAQQCLNTITSHTQTHTYWELWG